MIRPYSYYGGNYGIGLMMGEHSAKANINMQETLKNNYRQEFDVRF